MTKGIIDVSHFHRVWNRFGPGGHISGNDLSTREIETVGCALLNLWYVLPICLNGGYE